MEEIIKSYAKFFTGGNDMPVIAAAIHDGHNLREEVLTYMNLTEEVRLREEDPFTSVWTSVAGTRIIATQSRFEFDLNRPRDKAVYISPEDAWGLKVWKSDLPEDVAGRSLDSYDLFYKDVYELLKHFEARFGKFVILDLHTYCYRRDGADKPPADPAANPEVNIGTGTMNRVKWESLVDRFISDLRKFDYSGRQLDVRENVKFRGGNFGRWIHENFPDSACCLSIELKKFFMDEWTGTPYDSEVSKIGEALKSTIPGIIDELKKLTGS
jgi:N-formylglutamate amidohydrolase